MSKLFGWIKDHPYLAAGGVFVIGVLLVLMFRRKPSAATGSGNVTVQTPDAAAIQAGMQLQGMQLSAQTQMAAIAADLQKSVDVDATHLQEAALNYHLGSENISASKELALAQNTSREKLTAIQLGNQANETYWNTTQNLYTTMTNADTQRELAVLNSQTMQQLIDLARNRAA